ncbi:hypothetical protein NQZ68_013229 [Dissostichus eleginoides]|nr:hypothetical protein NQZ68_013229 [Dissostichus eleginoides]
MTCRLKLLESRKGDIGAFPDDTKLSILAVTAGMRRRQAKFEQFVSGESSNINGAFPLQGLARLSTIPSSATTDRDVFIIGVEVEKLEKYTKPHNDGYQIEASLRQV